MEALAALASNFLPESNRVTSVADRYAKNNLSQVILFSLTYSLQNNKIKSKSLNKEIKSK